MGVRNVKREELARIECKTLDAKFRNVVEEGLGCSSFEAEAVLEAVKEVYFPFLDQAAPMAPPGKVTLIAVSADEPAGKAVADCEKLTVSLSLHRGPEDDRLLREHGPQGFRLARIPDLCQEALSLGVLLTREDLAYHIFCVGTRTISRDLALLRARDSAAVIPLRSTVQDIGPVLTHRVQIVRLALAGKTTSQISAILHHSPQAVTNYVSTFSRTAFLARRGLVATQIAYLLRRGPGLIARYLELFHEAEKDPNVAYHLDQLLRVGEAVIEKKIPRRRTAHGR
jgi:hypothetical protein